MGNLQAMAYAEMVADGSIGLETALTAHLTSNFYPALSGLWVAPAVAAVEAARDDRYEDEIDISGVVEETRSAPRGAVEDGARVVATAGVLVQAMKLDAFVAMAPVDE